MSDLISRQAAIEAIGEVHPLDYNGQAILTRLKELPTIDPVKHGRWVEHAWEWHKCSVCGETAPSDDMVYEYLTPYCPYCGAKMDGGEDETD